MKSEKKKCIRRSCEKPARGHGMCDKHRRQKWVKENPIRDKYNNLRGNAKRRKIKFDLTFDEFKKFCEETDYINRCGRNKDNLTIDRKKRSEGYCYSNLQVLENAVNRFKYAYLERNISDIDPELVEQAESEEDLPLLPHEIVEFKNQLESIPF